MKIVVTGGSGKAGRWIVRELTSGDNGRTAHDVLVFDQKTEADADRVRYLAGDVRDQGQVFEALAGSDAVIHLAGVPRHGIVPNEVTVRTNVMAAFNVHEAAWRLGISRVLTMSSEAVLGWAPGAWVREVPPDYLPVDEDHPLLPQDAYGVSKQAVEAIARSYSQKSDVTTVILRPPRVVTPEELRSLRESQGLTPNRFALFNYIDARDLADICRLGVERPLSGSNIFFVGAGDSLAREALCSLYPRLMPAIGNKAEALTEGRSSVSLQKIKRVLGWTPRHSWRSGAI
jgi:nucleoside-diphosphate-sugar epimerase